MDLRISIVLAACLAVFVATPALADDLEAAGAEFWAGDEAYRAGEFERAIEHFLAADELAPNPELHEHIGRAYLHLGDLQSAVSAFQRYSESGDDAREAMIPVLAELRETLYDEVFRASRFAVQRALRSAAGDEADPEEVRRNELGTQMRAVPVQFLSEPRGAEVFIDGSDYGPFGVTPLTVDLFVGPHEIEISIPHYAPQRLTIDVQPREAGGEIRSLRVELERERVDVSLTIEPPTARASWISADGERTQLQSGTHLGVLPAGPGIFVLQDAGRDRRIEDVIELEEGESEFVRTLELAAPAVGSSGFVVSIGTILVHSSTPGASVRVDGREIGRGSGTFEATVSPGAHSVEVSKDGHETRTEEVTVDANGEIEVTVPELERRRRRR